MTKIILIDSFVIALQNSFSEKKKISLHKCDILQSHLETVFVKQKFSKQLLTKTGKDFRYLT